MTARARTAVSVSLIVAAAGLACLISARTTRASRDGDPDLHRAQAIAPQELAMLFGGCWEEGCETDRFTCNASWGSQCLTPLSTNDPCARCESDAEVETCHDWGICIPWLTCSDCTVDENHDCGQETLGQCLNPSGCDDDNVGQNDCGEATQCHTS